MTLEIYYKIKVPQGKVKDKVTNMISKTMTEIKSHEQLNKILNSTEPLFIYKHSTRCNICTDAFEVIEDTFGKDVQNLPPVYYLDLLSLRSISNEIEERLNVVHQSPQLILVKNGAAVWHMSHWKITKESILEAV